MHETLRAWPVRCPHRRQAPERSDDDLIPFTAEPNGHEIMAKFMQNEAQQQQAQAAQSNPDELRRVISNDDMPTEIEGAGGEEKKEHVQTHIHAPPTSQANTPTCVTLHSSHVAVRSDCPPCRIGMPVPAWYLINEPVDYQSLGAVVRGEGWEEGEREEEERGEEKEGGGGTRSSVACRSQSKPCWSRRSSESRKRCVSAVMAESSAGRLFAIRRGGDRSAGRQ